MKRKNTIYGNCQVYSPSGELMFLCLEKKANWYLYRNLAKIIGIDPLQIQLTFEPGGKGHDDEYYLSSKINACVVCGSTNLEDLTKHHIVPIEYRKHFPEYIKSRSSHDIVVICQDHHYDYENNFAQHLKHELMKKYNILQTKLSIDKIRTHKAYNIAKVLIDPEKVKKIPESRIKSMITEVRDIFGHDDVYEIATSDINKIIYNENLVLGKQLVDKIEDIEKFIKMWRQHFVDSMKPQYMPIGWSIDYSINTN